MSGTQPFAPLTVNGSVGKTVIIQATLSPGTVAVFPAGTTSILAQCIAPGGAAGYIRISTESSTAITAVTSTNPDTPLYGSGITGAPTVRLFAAAGPGGATTVAVAATVTSSPVTVYLTPGIGGFS